MAKTRRNKVILTCAVTGAIHTPTMSPHLPCGVQGIVESAVGAAKAGASIVHIHARREDGEPTSDLGVMREILAGIKARTDAPICISTGGALSMTVEERLASIAAFQPELASCNAGTMNFAYSEMAKGMDNPLYDWELPFLRKSYERYFLNTFANIEYAVDIMNKHGTKQEFEIFDLGQVNNIAYFAKKGVIPKPIYLQFVLGVMGGAALTLGNLLHCIGEAKRLLGDDIEYSVVAGGRRLFRYEAVSAVNGGHCRVGMEDSLIINAQGDLAPSNAAQVEKMLRILRDLDFEAATPDEAREILGLKGGDKVNF